MPSTKGKSSIPYCDLAQRHFRHFNLQISDSKTTATIYSHQILLWFTQFSVLMFSESTGEFEESERSRVAIRQSGLSTCLHESTEDPPSFVIAILSHAVKPVQKGAQEPLM
ncbi:unnamed protein product, partial [Nesidiocoris tenuis]